MPSVGTVSLRSRTVSRRDVESCTGLAGYRNILHYDEDLAAANPLSNDFGATAPGNIDKEGLVPCGLSQASPMWQ